MSDLGAGGTIDYSNLPAYSVRSQQTNTTDIRRTVAPTPSVCGTFHVLNAGFSGAGDVINGALPGAGGQVINQGVLFRVVDNSNNSIGHIGITQAGAAVGDAVLLEEGDEIYIPAKNLNDIIIGHTTATHGFTCSALGE